MTETATPETPTDAESFSDYVQTENRKERADPPGPPTPEVVPSEAPALDAPAAKAANEEPEPADAPAVTDQPRAKDGTFKKVSNTGEWARNRTLTAKLRDAEAELQRLRQPAPVAPTPTPSPAATTSAPATLPAWHDPADPEPTLETYLDRPDPYATLAIEGAKWAVRDAQRQFSRQQQEATWAKQRQEVEARIETFAAQHPDYQEKVAAIDDVKFEPPVLSAIAEDLHGPEIVYYLANHPDEARRIATLTPVSAVKEVGKLLTRVIPADSAQGHPPAVSRATPPIKPVGSSLMTPVSALDPETTEFSDWVRSQNLIDRQRRRDGL